METGTKLYLLRMRLNLSQEALAQQMGVSQSTIANWEQGKSIKHQHIAKLAQCLQTTPETFFENATWKKETFQTNVGSYPPNSKQKKGIAITIRFQEGVSDDFKKIMAVLAALFHQI
jgi:transcriptional regulator with XRE-family HTH domain